MNLQRREEIRVLIADQNIEDPQALTDCRNALAELLAHIDTLEQTAAERVIADGKARAVVVPELTKSTVEEIAEAETRVSSDGPFASREQAALAEVGSYIRRLRAIPADRVLGEGERRICSEELMYLRSLERYARKHGPESIQDVIGCLDHLRANQGGM